MGSHRTPCHVCGIVRHLVTGGTEVLAEADQ